MSIHCDKIAIKINKRRNIYFGSQFQICHPLAIWTHYFEPVKPETSWRKYMR